jgi:hypothetical protein
MTTQREAIEDPFSEEEIEHIAKIAHAATQAHKTEHDTIVSWEDGKAASIASVKTAIKHPWKGSKEFHDEWIKQQKDAAAIIIHPHDYSNLSENQRARNKLFYDVVHSLTETE